MMPKILQFLDECEGRGLNMVPVGDIILAMSGNLKGLPPLERYSRICDCVLSNAKRLKRRGWRLVRSHRLFLILEK